MPVSIYSLNFNEFKNKHIDSKTHKSMTKSPVYLFVCFMATELNISFAKLIKYNIFPI